MARGGRSPLPPFGLSLDAYATLQRTLAPDFGFLPMGAIAAGLVAHLRLAGKKVPAFRVLNVLGVTFFLPFVLPQTLDLPFITTVGWRQAAITTLHTLVLMWEAVATMAIPGELYGIGARDRIVGTVLIVAVWVAISATLWR